MDKVETMQLSYPYGFGYLQGTIKSALELTALYEMNDELRERLEQALETVENVGWQG